jgi:hypothetical protein
MNILEEAKLIRNEVAKLRPDKRRRYPDELRARILEWVARATESGLLESECSRAIGVKSWRFTMWRRLPLAKREPMALVPIEAPPVAFAAVSVISPSGLRVEGLGLDQVIQLLRELA